VKIIFTRHHPSLFYGFSFKGYMWKVANFTLPRQRYGVNREPDVKFKFEFLIGHQHF